jgi:hypothetical protein
MLGFREILGLVLMLIGLALIGVLVMLALNRQIFEALAVSFPAAIVFRAGVGLFRLATAARIAVKLNAVDK